jgi:hypothetical protein
VNQTTVVKMEMYSSNGANLPVDRLVFTVPESNFASEEEAIAVLSDAINRSLGGGSSVRVSKMAHQFVLSIVQQHSRLSEILPREISEWIRQSSQHKGLGTKRLQIVLPHSVIVNAGQGMTLAG